MTERSPWRIAFETLAARPTARTVESVSVRENAKGEPQFEVNGVRQDDETLLDCALRVESVRASLRRSLATDPSAVADPFTEALTEVVERG